MNPIRLSVKALEGRHNPAQGVNPVCMASPHLPLHAPTARGGGRDGKRHIEIGLSPYPMLCRPSRAIHGADNPYFMPPFHGYTY